MPTIIRTNLRIVNVMGPPIDTAVKQRSPAATGNDDVGDEEGAFSLLRTRELRNFWSAYLRLGLLVLGAESTGALIYFVLTPNGAHRRLLIAIVSAAIAIAIGDSFVVEQVATQTWCARFSLVWTLLSGVLLTIVCHLDGGIDSPLVYLLVLPIASAALGLSVPAVLACGSATLLELFLVWVSEPRVSRVTSDLVMFALVLIGLVAFAIGFARYRSRLQGAQTELEDELAKRAETDSLTGCLNHGAFYDRLGVEIYRALRTGEPVSLLMIDVDLFKSYNDAHGHVAGDNALAELGKTLRTTSRKFDVVGRVGGDEFAVILPRTTLFEAGVIAHRVTRTLERPNGLEITASVGYGELDRLDPSATRLVRDADAGLYEAKAGGRDRSATAQASERVTSEAIRLAANTKLGNERIREAHRATAEALSILDAYQMTDSVGLGFVDREFRILRANPMLASLNGNNLEDQLGRTIEEVVPEIWRQLEERYRGVIASNTPSVNVEVSGEITTDPGHIHHWLTNLYPVRIEQEVIGIGIVVVDITDRKMLEESQVSLTRAVVDALANAIEMRDPYTDGHQGRVAQLAVELAIDLGVAADEALFQQRSSASQGSSAMQNASSLSNTPRQDPTYSHTPTFPITFARWCSSTMNAWMDQAIRVASRRRTSPSAPELLPLRTYSMRCQQIDRTDQLSSSRSSLRSSNRGLALSTIQASLRPVFVESAPGRAVSVQDERTPERLYPKSR